MNKKRCIMILADGARYSTFQKLLQQGQLPAFEEIFLKEGKLLKGVSVFPSTTGPAYLPYLTGCFPGTCNIPGIRWFDKQEYSSRVFSTRKFRSYVGLESYLMDRDMNSKLPTLFKLIPKSFNIFSAVSKGAKRHVSKHAKIWYWFYCHLTDRWDVADKAAFQKTLKIIEGDFEFLFVVFPGIDELSHLSSPEHPSTLEAYQKLDTYFGEVGTRLKELGKYDDTLFLLVSDHGLSECHTHYGVGEMLETHGLKTLYHPKVHRLRLDAASMTSGNAMTHIYLKGQNQWAERLTFEVLQNQYAEILAELKNEPAVGLVLTQAASGWINVESKIGKAIIKENPDSIEYQVLTGDPFGYSALPTKMTQQEALAQTIHTPYPDALVQIPQLFRSPRTGDIVLSAEPGYDLRLRFENPEHQSGHGALHEQHMLVPILINTPVTQDYARSVDVFPTVLKLMGLEIPTGIDGSIIN